MTSGRSSESGGTTVDPIRKQIEKELARLDGTEVAIQFTPDGEIKIRRVEGKDVPQPLDVEELEPLPPRFAEEHRDVMETIFSAVTQINENPKRSVPLSRSELLGEFKANKRVVKNLEKWGFIRSRIIRLVPEAGLKKKSGQALAIYYFTPQGRAYVRREFDEKYGL